MADVTDSAASPESPESPESPASAVTVDTTPTQLGGDDTDSLLLWCLATFHTALFVLVPVALIHGVGALGDLLGSLSTVVGLVLYLALWATTWWTNRRLLATTPFERSEWWAVLKASVKWGGVTGSCFLLELVVVAVVQVALAGGFGTPDLASIPPLLLILAVGTLIAFVVGGLVGVVQATLDLAALGVADALL
jgi:hypothetical protein